MTHLLLFGAVFTLAALIYFLHRFGAAWSMRGWRRTQGRVVTAEMRRGKKKSPDGCLLYEPVLRYSYTVGGHEFEGSRFTHRAIRNPAGLTTLYITRLTQGSEVPVYYHPRNPAEAVVQPFPWQGSAMGALTCAVLLVTLTTVLWFA